MRNDLAFYKPGLDALRLLAFLMVFAHHILPWEPSDYERRFGPLTSWMLAGIANSFSYGLCIFFFLSAYLICSILLIEYDREKTIHLGAFYIRRILRIWPLYFAAVAIGIVLGLFVFTDEGAVFLRSYVVFLGNWYYLDHDWTNNPVTPLWSISIEEQFYLTFPVLFLVLGRSLLPYLSTALITISVAALYYQGNHGWAIDTAIWINSLSQLIFFASGIALALMMHGRTVRLGWFARLALLAAATAFFLAATFVFGAKQVADATSGLDIALGYISMTLGCASLVLAVLEADVSIPRPILYLGKISFGLYVFHEFALHFFDYIFADVMHIKMPFYLYVPASLALTLCLAILSYRFLELPFLRLRNRFTYVENRPN